MRRGARATAAEGSTTVYAFRPQSQPPESDSGESGAMVAWYGAEVRYMQVGGLRWGWRSSSSDHHSELTLPALSLLKTKSSAARHNCSAERRPAGLFHGLFVYSAAQGLGCGMMSVPHIRHLQNRGCVGPAHTLMWYASGGAGKRGCG